MLDSRRIKTASEDKKQRKSDRKDRRSGSPIYFVNDEYEYLSKDPIDLYGPKIVQKTKNSAQEIRGKSFPCKEGNNPAELVREV